jgi:hypothetical protein
LAKQLSTFLPQNSPNIINNRQVQQQAIKGEWNFALNKVYTIGIFDFIADSDSSHYFGKHMIVNLQNMSQLPSKMREPIFLELLETCEKGNFEEKELTVSPKGWGFHWMS